MQLRNLAFGGPGKNKGKQQSSNKTGSGDDGVSEVQWEEWKKMDSEVSHLTYLQKILFNLITCIIYYTL